MALVASTRGIPQPMDRIRYPEVDVTGLNRSGNSECEIVIAEPNPARTSIPRSFAPPSPAVIVGDEATYVALGKEVKEAESILGWALRNSRGRKFYILHVHQAAQKIPILGANVPIGQLEEYRVRQYHEAERQGMHKILDKFILMCQKAGVRAEKLYIEMDSVEKGILELISRYGIKKLIMGAAANKKYSKKMMEPRSKKAIFVWLKAPYFCHILFVCKGHLIHSRESTSKGVNLEVMSPVIQSSPRTGQSNSLLSRAVTEGQVVHIQSTGFAPDYRRIRSDNHVIRYSTWSPLDIRGGVTPRSRVGVQESTDGLDWMSRRSPSSSHFSSCSSTEMDEDSGSISVTSLEGSGNELESHLQLHSDKEHCYASPSPGVIGGTMDDELFDRLQQYVEEAENSRQEAYEESIKLRKAEMEAIEARCRAKASETMYSEELRRRKESEKSLARGKEEVEKMKSCLDKVKENIRVALEQKSSLESQIETSDKMVQELEQKMVSAVELLQKFKNERDELQVERDNTLREADELRKSQVEPASSASMSCFFSEHSFSELEEATRNFDPSLKIGEGGYGSIYKGLLRHTQVAIKMLHPHSLQGPLEFHQEVNILSKLRHPNLVTLIGTCPEAWALIYEYLPNGSLEDRLNCKGNSPPLSWQTRIRIAAELCSVLIFLHSCSPQCIVHGDLKPANILLDANYVSKLSDFGICCVLSEDEFSDNNTTFCCRTNAKGTFAYMDPEFLATGELTPKSDVYSFGIILLRLLTGKSALGIRKEVQYALEKGKLKDILDPTAGDWPFVQAKLLAHLAMGCCETTHSNRPDLASEVWRVLEPMRVSCGASSSRLNSEEQSHIPSYFICPIFQEIMQDPVVAADGFTYEAEALKGWLDGGHDTSPMTNLKLTHCNLVPNRALRSAIQEWLQQP